MKWEEVTTNGSDEVLFWDGEEIVFSITYHCFSCDRIYGSIGWIRGFSIKDGLTKTCEFCG